MRYRHDDDASSTTFAFPLISAALIAAGMALRLWQYLGASALWTDEAALGNNIVSRPLRELLAMPLAGHQAAPIGFLLIEKAVVSALGASELALRAFPVFCSFGALFLLWRVARRLLPAQAIPLVLAPFALAPPLIFLGTEAKQYSSDVAISLVLLAMALGLERRKASTRRIIAATLGGAIAVWFSQPAVIVLAGLGAALLIDAVASRNRRAIAGVACLVFAWSASALASILVARNRLQPSTRRYMYNFWADGFWPLSLRHPATLVWPFRQIAMMMGQQLAFPAAVAVPAGICAMAGLWLTWRRDQRTAMLLTAPLFVALGASAAHLYPFKERLALFVIPLLLLLTAAGIVELARAVRSPRGLAVVGAAATALVLVIDARELRAAPPVYRREEITPALGYFARHRLATDALYVYYGAIPAFEFYAARDAIPAARTWLGGCHRGNTERYLAELDSLRGHARLWVLFAHELPTLHEREGITEYLDEIGTARDSVITTGHDVDGAATRASLYLYDLSDSTRLRPVANTPVFARPALNPRLLCAADIP
jgi:hypothetical protein